MNRKRDELGRFVKEDHNDNLNIEGKENMENEEINEDVNEELHKKREKKRNKKKNKQNKSHLFSLALFKENFKSHLKSLLIVSFGNAAIMAIIIGILSGLHINSTSTALKDLFGNADTESMVKEGAISLYSAFNGSASSFDLVKDGKKTIKGSLNTVLEMPNDSNKTSKIEALKLVYKGYYLVSSGTEEEKHLASKEYAINEAKKTFTSQTSEAEQKLTISLLDAFFEEYKKDNTSTTKVLLQKTLENNLGDIVGSVFNLEGKEKEEFIKDCKILTSSYYKEGSNKDEILTEYSLRFIRYAISGEEKEFAFNLSKELEETFLKDKTTYIENESIENDILKENIIEEVLKIGRNTAYIKYLPNFVVDYYTSNFGYPITYVPTGEFNENGTEKTKMIEVKVYNPSVFIKKESKMGTTSNLVEKIHKKAITGEDYTEEQIEEAKNKAKDDILILEEKVTSFFDEYLKDYDEYHQDNKINDDLLIRKSVLLVKETAAKTLIDDFNANNKEQITSIDEITVNNYSMDGKELMQYVDSYASSGITSYKTYRDDSILNGYSENEAQMIAVAKGSLGIIDQLPSSIQDSLSEMGEMNTYGIIVGVIAFGIAVLLIPMVYTILTANSLVAEKVESGSLAFTMSTPISRHSFIFTSGVYLVFSEVFMAVILLVVSLIAQMCGGYFGSGDLLTSLPILDILAYALGNFMVALAISGICFMSSCYFNKTNTNIGVSGGISIFFFICAILGLFATKAIPGTIRISTMNIFNYLTIFTLFDSLSVMEGMWETYFLKLLVLLVIAIVTYIIGSIKFTKKDLPL